MTLWQRLDSVDWKGIYNSVFTQFLRPQTEQNKSINLRWSVPLSLSVNLCLTDNYRQEKMACAGSEKYMTGETVGRIFSPLTQLCSFCHN